MRTQVNFVVKSDGVEIGHPLRGGYADLVIACRAEEDNPNLPPAYRYYAKTLAHLARNAVRHIDNREEPEQYGIHFFTFCNVVAAFTAKCERWVAEHPVKEPAD